MSISGTTKLIAHIGYPTESFRAPMIYNPYFESRGIDAVVVPMGCRVEDFHSFMPNLFHVTNVLGALITMPHKVAAVSLLDEASLAVQIACSCNAIKRGLGGELFGDMFDGEGFVRSLKRKGHRLHGSSALVVGAGGVGSAIAASLAAVEVARMVLYDSNLPSAEALASRLRTHYPDLEVSIGSNDPAGYDLVVNATPLGMLDGDPLPVDIARLQPQTFVGEVVMKREITPFLAAAMAKGCRIQVGLDMLYEMIPAYLEFFGLPTTSTDELRRLAKIDYGAGTTNVPRLSA